MNSTFVISLDFELLWGVREIATRSQYGANIRGARKAIPQMLELFQAYNVRATWATVGLLFCRSKAEILEMMPEPERVAAYINPAMSAYAYLDEVGANEEEDPFYFGGSLIDQIAQTDGQEIATHTFSHYNCLEKGSSPQTFSADLKAAIEIARLRGIDIRTIVFPRNQYGPEHLRICQSLGLIGYRGIPDAWAHQPMPRKSRGAMRRGLRLLDAYSGILGDQEFSEQSPPNLVNIPGNRFLRPAGGWLKPAHGMHLATVRKEMSATAAAGRSYHLWWHPHNFGRNRAGNIAALKSILEHAKMLEDQFGMRSANMADLATQPTATPEARHGAEAAQMPTALRSSLG